MTARERVAVDSSYKDAVIVIGFLIVVVLVLTTVATHYAKEVARLCP